VAEGAEVALGQEIGVAVSAERQGRSAERRGLYDADRLHILVGYIRTFL
tara:strand:+ start:745 stop:891 length:147 start_codon:yes stop_codon:yes gene_type:complete